MSLLDSEACYRALLARDSRFDGRFFVAVKTTGIYCRPICRVRPPKAGNCEFVNLAEQAESKGYRPCLRCRPELAPGHLAHRQGLELAQAARQLLLNNPRKSLPEIARLIGVSDRHLRRVFQREFAVSPIQFEQTQRLLFAKRLLTDTRLAMSRVAQASGFQSSRRFNALFQERYRMNPTRFRADQNAEQSVADDVCLYLSYRPPFDWAWMLGFFKVRAIEGVELVADGRYQRTTEMGWFCVEDDPKNNRVIVNWRDSQLNLDRSIPLRIRQLFDLDCEPLAIADSLGSLARSFPGIRLPGAWDGFELAVRAILGQQVTVKAASTLASRFAQRFGTTVFAPVNGLCRIFPRPERLCMSSLSDIGELGIIRRRGEAIQTIAQQIVGGELVLNPGLRTAAQIQELSQRLNSIAGIGPWTSEYIAMRVAAHTDAFPPGDVAVMKALSARTPREAEKRVNELRPWRAYAVMHLWASLNSNA